MGPFEQQVEEQFSEGSLSAKHARDNVGYEPPDVRFGFYVVLPEDRVRGDKAQLKSGDSVFVFIPGLKAQEKSVRRLAYETAFGGLYVQGKPSEIRVVCKLSGYGRHSISPEDISGAKGVSEKIYKGSPLLLPVMEEFDVYNLPRKSLFI